MDQTVSKHYAKNDLLDAIARGLATPDGSPDRVTVDDLAPVDEFHMGGRQATEALMDQLGFTNAHHLLDIGCGLGGAARYVASRYGSRITGIDVTPDFIETGNTLCEWVDLSNQIALQEGDALNMPFHTASFDGAYMLHVGMNISDKSGLFAEVHRVLKPGATFGIYDIMRTGDGDLTYPVPWASNASMNYAAYIQDYAEALSVNGFQVIHTRNRRDFAVSFYEQMQIASANRMEPPPLGLHLVMGPTAKTRLSNMVDGLNSSIIAPIEIIVTA